MCMQAAASPPWTPAFDTLRLDIKRPLGRGAFGEVFLVKAFPASGGILEAAQSRAGGLFALKRTALSGVSEEGVIRAKEEARLLQRLGAEHESILQCFDFRVVPGASPALELLLEYASLGDLSSRIRACKETDAGSCPGLPEAEVVSYGRDVAAGLAHIHALTPKILHRDVKPANVVLFPTSETGSLPRAKLADFGIARIMEADGSFARAATVIGTPHYFSPEICRGETYDERSDAWALGCVIYEMLCLHRPFHQAEKNVAALIVRVMEGRYDRQALEQQASHYNGLLIFTLFGLLNPDVDRRSRAGEALQALQKLGLDTGRACDVAATAVPWWKLASDLRLEKTSEIDVVKEGNANRVGDPEDDAEESWAGACGVNVDDCATINPLEDALLTYTKPTLEPTLTEHTIDPSALHGAAAGIARAQRMELTANPCTPGAAEVKKGHEESPLSLNLQMSELLSGSLSSLWDSPKVSSVDNLDCSFDLTPVTGQPSSSSLRQNCRMEVEYPKPSTEYLIETSGSSLDHADKPVMSSTGLASMEIGAMGLMISEPPGVYDEPCRKIAEEVAGDSWQGSAGPMQRNCGGYPQHRSGSAGPMQRNCAGYPQQRCARPRVFLRSLASASSSPEPCDAPVMFCFADDRLPWQNMPSVPVQASAEVVVELQRGGWLEVELRA